VSQSIIASIVPCGTFINYTN